MREAALMSLAFWVPLFYITRFLPSATFWAGAAAKDESLHG